jgi:hypothetical protein
MHIHSEEYFSMSLAVDNPILNNPFEGPKECRIYDEGQSKKLYRERKEIWL